MGTMTPSAPQSAATHQAPQRQAWIDNLRVLVIVGVIGAHVAIIYVLDVGWYYEERTASAITEAVLAAVFSPGLLFGMGLLFLVAGLFTPRALQRKGTARFAIDRLWKLGVPAIVYLFVVNPAMDALGDRARGRGESAADYFRHSYWSDVELGVAWFIVALLAFSLVYAAWRSRHPARTEDAGGLRRVHLLTAAIFIATASFVVRIWYPFLDGEKGWTLNLWEYPQMATLFVLGVLASERTWLAEGLTPELRRTCGHTAVVGVALAALAAVFTTLTDDPDAFLGGFRVEATLIPAIEATLTLGMSLWAVDWFQRRWNHAGPFVRGLGRASFAAYLVHAPIGVALAAGLRDVSVPAEAKFLAVYALSIVASFGLGLLVTRSHAAGRVL